MEDDVAGQALDHTQDDNVIGEDAIRNVTEEVTDTSTETPYDSGLAGFAHARDGGKDDQDRHEHVQQILGRGLAWGCGRQVVRPGEWRGREGENS